MCYTWASDNQRGNTCKHQGEPDSFAWLSGGRLDSQKNACRGFGKWEWKIHQFWEWSTKEIGEDPPLRILQAKLPILHQEDDLGNRGWKDGVPPSAIPSPRRARSLLSLLIYWCTHLKMGCSSGAFSREVGWKQVFQSATGQLHNEMTVWNLLGLMGTEWVGIQMKVNNDSPRSMLCLCACRNISSTHTHTMPRLGSSEACEGPQWAACGCGLVRPFQPYSAMPDLEIILTAARHWDVKAIMELSFCHIG